MVGSAAEGEQGERAATGAWLVGARVPESAGAEPVGGGGGGDAGEGYERARRCPEG